MKSRRDQIAEARRLGVEVRPVRRTGEIRFISPFDDEPPVTMNNRRTDGTRAVESLLRRAKARQNHSDGDPPSA